MTKGPVLITGAARRIGEALALGLGQAGHPIAVHYRSSKKEADSVASVINSGGGKAVAVRADLLDQRDLEALIGMSSKALGRPMEILINNAAAFVRDDIHDFSEESFAQNLGTNLKAPMILSRSFAAQLPKGAKGNIINIVDQRVLGLSRGFLTYTVSKHALYDLTRLLALELAPAIRVNAIGPGPTLKSIHQNDADFAAEAGRVPLGRGPELDEFSRVAEFILSTPSLTGQMITLDGGQHLL